MALCRPAKREPQRSPLRLSLAEREEISRGLAAGESLRAIARRLGRAPSTVSREVAATVAGVGIGRVGGHGPRCGGAASEAGEARDVPAAAGGGGGQARAALVTAADRGLAGVNLPRRSGDAGVARDDLPVAVRAGPRRAAQGADPLPAHRAGHAAARRADSLMNGQGQLRDIVNISRAARRGRRPGGARPLGRRPALRQTASSAIATLVERSTRFVMLVALPDGTRAELVADALRPRSSTLPDQLRRSLTWDQGKEMAAARAVHRRHRRARSTSATRAAPGSAAPTRTPTACCASTSPKAPTSRTYTQADLDAVAAELNGRPRQTLGWRTPSQALDEALR